MLVRARQGLNTYFLSMFLGSLNHLNWSTDVERKTMNLGHVCDASFIFFVSTLDHQRVYPDSAWLQSYRAVD